MIFIKITINLFQVYGLNFSAELYMDTITDVLSKRLKFTKHRTLCHEWGKYHELSISEFQEIFIIDLVIYKNSSVKTRDKLMN